MSGLNAQRFKGKPLRQPTYSFGDVPHCSKDLQHSSLQEVTTRENFIDAMAEMVLLCKEAMRRVPSDRLKDGKKSSKPLSLEYIADRLDVDDPLFGYIVRTSTKPSQGVSEKWKEGMFQGFVTVTTFTNWQKTFRWDSLHDNAFSYDPLDLSSEMAAGMRRYDEDGSLAETLQNTVRCGDPWNEGIVWPRIAEISLLGGLGCGKALLSLVIEKLECMKANGNRNYDYVVLQATDNSVPFYESMGFVRIGAVTEDQHFGKKQGEDSETETESESGEGSAPAQADAAVSPSEIVSSPVTTYVTTVAGECPADIAKKFGVNVWDIIFLNQYVYKDISTRSRLLEGTSLFVPADPVVSKVKNEDEDAPRWYVASENDTPKMIAKKFHVNCAELVKANRERLPELQSFARLKEGTRIRVSHFHIHDDKHVPYCHWTFPDDTFSSSVPSYMMVRKLNRRSGAAAKYRPIEYSLATPVSSYSPPPAAMFITAPVPCEPEAVSAGKTSKKRKRHAEEPIPPKRPLSGYMRFCGEKREELKKKMAGQSAAEFTKVVSKMWQELTDDDKAPYQAQYEKGRVAYQKSLDKYKKDLAKFHAKYPELHSEAKDKKPSTLFNKVVKLNADGVEQTGSEFEYYFALTYIPDLQWVHLAPMRRVGFWGPNKPKAEGRPIWMLVDEKEGKEVDISSTFCIPVKSRAMRHHQDADQEQWDIIDELDVSTHSSAMSQKFAPIFTNRAKHGLEGQTKQVPPTPSYSGVPSTMPLVSHDSRGRPSRKAAVLANQAIHNQNGSPDVSVRLAASETPQSAYIPRREVGAPMAVIPSPGVSIPIKRGRGRPPKKQPKKRGSSCSPKKLSAGPGLASPKKRGRGRPRKNPLPASGLANTSPVKRGPGRPRKTLSPALVVPIKRGPGRPPKSPSPATELAEAIPEKRGPGRPRKNSSPGSGSITKRGPGRPPKSQPSSFGSASSVSPTDVTSPIAGIAFEEKRSSLSHRSIRARSSRQAAVAACEAIHRLETLSSPGTPLKRGRGRPPKKRGPSHPPKGQSSPHQMAVSKKRGRPKAPVPKTDGHGSLLERKRKRSSPLGMDSLVAATGGDTVGAKRRKISSPSPGTRERSGRQAAIVANHALKKLRDDSPGKFESGSRATTRKDLIRNDTQTFATSPAKKTAVSCRVY